MKIKYCKNCGYETKKLDNKFCHKCGSELVEVENIEILNIVIAAFRSIENVYDVNFVRKACDSDIKNIILDLYKYRDLWGQDLSEPVIYINDINLTRNDIQIIGKNADTVKFEKFGVTYIQFHAKQLIEDLAKYDDIKMEVIGRANINEWMGNITYQIMIEGYEVTNGALGF